MAAGRERTMEFQYMLDDVIGQGKRWMGRVIGID